MTLVNERTPLLLTPRPSGIDVGLDINLDAARVIQPNRANLRLATTYLIAILSAIAFPVSYIVVYVQQDWPSWCFSDTCIDSKRSMQLLVRNDLAIFHGFLALTFTSLILFTAPKFRMIHRLLSARIFDKCSATVAEVGWFIAAMFAVGLSFHSDYQTWWNRRGPKWSKSWESLVLLTMFNSSGDALCLLMGFVVLPVSKNSTLATFFNLPYTNLIRVHMWLGQALFYGSVFHGGVGCAYYVITGRDIWKLLFTVPFGAAWGSSRYQKILGVIAIVFLLVVVLTSMSFVRIKFYNTFYLTHFLVFAFIAAAYFHASSCIFFMIPGLFLYTVDGVIRLQSRISSRTSKVTNVVFESCGYVTVTISTTAASHALPGQFMRVNFPAISGLEYHPWSIIHATPTSAQFMFAVPNESSWSARVRDLLRTFPGAAGSSSATEAFAVRLQGPYGKRLAVAAAPTRHYATDLAVFHVGGSGVAACIRAVDAILLRNVSRPEEAKTKVVVSWSARGACLQDLSMLQNWRSHSKESIQLHFFQTGEEGSQDTSGSASANLNLVCQRGHLGAILELESSLMAAPDLSVNVFVCGSAGFTADALCHVSQFARARPEFDVTVEVESFE
ncbi:hypothetical protein HDU84_005093 [Entophlyctis sp. JEL0112]|nr:hypothetical protein HDU84_005093 [Entophlyctis sp. JEL0112]